MTSNTNISSDQVDDELYEELLYEVLLYKKKDIIAIQEKFSMTVSEGPSINNNRNQTILIQYKKEKILKDLFGLLFDLVEELKSIQEKINICDHLILTILYQNMQDLMNVTFGEMSLGEIYHLLLYLKEDISII